MAKKYTKQADGRYRTSVTIGLNPDGSVLVMHPSGKTIRELEKKVEDIRRTYISPESALDREVLFKTYLLNWYEMEKKPNLAKSTRENYCTIINSYLIPALGNKRMAAVTYADLQKFMVEKMGKLGKTMIGDAHSILRNIFALATSTGVIDRAPAASLKKKSVKSESRRELTDKETEVVLKLGEEHEYGLLLLILFYTGARRGEVLGLRWDDIDFVHKEIHIERDIDFSTGDVGEVKTAESVRTVPLPDGLRDALQKCRGIGKNYVISAPRTKSFLNQSTYVRHYRELRIAMLEVAPDIESVVLNKKQIEKNPDLEPILGAAITAHYFRHNYASILYDAGVDVLTAQRYLGHADPATTLRIYTHLKKDRAKKGARKVIKAFGCFASSQSPQSETR